MMWKKFTIQIIIFTLTVALVMGGFNWFVDPFDIFESPIIAGFNANKPEIDKHERLHKAVMLSKMKPKTIFVGTSCTALGMDPLNQNLEPRDAYNCAVPAGLPVEYEYYIDTAVRNGAKHVIIGADFFTFYAKNISEPGFGDFNPYKYILSFDVFKASINTIGSKKPNTYLQTGRHNHLLMQFENDQLGGYKNRFRSFLKNLNPPYYTTGFSRDQTAHWKAFNRIIDKAHVTGTEVTLFISPSHALLWERIDKTQGWTMVEEFKKKLVAINEQAALQHNNPPFSFWDFSGYHELNTEVGPDDPNAKMKWHWDPVHYKKELGDIVLDRMFGGNLSRGQDYPDFGVKLTNQNIDDHLMKLRSDRAAWKLSRSAMWPQSEH